MVSKRRVECSLIGFQAPDIPKAPRSIRKRGPRKKEDGNLCPFELLAAVAGQLLEESESSNSSNVAEEKVNPCVGHVGNEEMRPMISDDKALNSDNLDHGSCAESSFVPETYTEKRHHTNAITDNLEKVDCDTKLGILDIKNDNASVFSNIDSERKVHSDNDKYQIGDLAMANKSNLKDPKQEYVNTNNIVLNNSERGIQLAMYRDHWKNVQLGIRDDDDNSFGGNKPNSKVRSSFRSQPHFMHRQIMKRGSSRFRIAAPRMRDRDLYNTNEGMKSFYRYRKNSYARERCHYAPIKKRRLYYHKSCYDQDTSCGSVSNSPTIKVHKKTTDPKVKLKIKSFVVPELYIDVAETDTVGSLKRAVMEAVTALLGGELRVGVVLKGRKCRDDNKTLLQTGISGSSNLDTLGFTLEPKLTHVSPARKILKASHSEVVENQSLRSPGTPVIDSGISNASIDAPPGTNVGEVNNTNDLVQIPHTPGFSNEITDGELSPDSKAIVPVFTMNPEALAMVPVNPKPKRSELSQRRTRRPFSVAEVEALVSAVEKLGTGRWRDVKMGAFENADHRTYVDLKDKWKTLVHTASISPQQRRGEPVPQELLDRVLAAHSYWSQHQSKQHGKNSNIEPMKIENVREEIAQA